MEFELQYWHWITFGIILMLSEIYLATFFIFWFGATAVVVGLILLPFPQLPQAGQLVLWAALSSLLAWSWFKYLKPLSIDRTKAGLSREAIVGETGQVLRIPNGESRGKLRFPAPILGSDEWEIMSTDSLAVGDRVSVEDILGNSLIVRKI